MYQHRYQVVSPINIIVIGEVIGPLCKYMVYATWYSPVLEFGTLLVPGM